eukprot:CAMPEP_0172198862 /NCGR_PEP_ID=MMETSP1050-20130122/28342_1 /TAXON_ID=233186 /ORGANISM="Cryptomonas curvata, Strain CCAP979/52" /LENGTH=124 /DNA_ID=CAMNT_0012875769 /DNA_START=68 /DNA_END=439 /DNA_ORIENTATION=+
MILAVSHNPSSRISPSFRSTSGIAHDRANKNPISTWTFALRLKGGSDLETFDREAFEAVMKRRFFFGPSFQIHGGVSGLFDYGPPGCAMKACMLNMWREHFVVEDGMLEVDCAALTPEPVLKAS